VPQRHREVWTVALSAMQREAGRAVDDLLQRTERAASDLQDWLQRRANVICGVAEPVVDDLFGASPRGPEWRFATAPLERLARYAADASNSPERRREADGTIRSFQVRTDDLTAHGKVAEPVLHPIGMLMLVPA
jgi:hypothetical protein